MAVKRIKKAKVKKLKRPRFGPSRTTGRLNPGTRHFSVPVHGSRRRVRGEAAAAGDYQLNADAFAVEVVGFTGQSFVFPGTNRTLIDSDGVLQTVAANVLRVESSGLLLERASGNFCLQSRNLTTLPWTTTGSPIITQNAVGVDGAANKAWTLEDDSAIAFEYLQQQFDTTIAFDNYILSLSIAKTVGATTYPLIQLNAGSVRGIIVDTNNGAVYDKTASAPDTKGITDAGDFWRVFLKIPNTLSATLDIEIYPAAADALDGSTDATLTGSIVVDAIQLETGSYISPSSYIDNDGLAASADLALDGDCSAGTLTTGAGWAHDAGNSEYDANFASGDLVDPGILTAGKLYRIKVVAGNMNGGFYVKAGTIQSQSLINSNGTYYFYLVSDGTDLSFSPSGGFLFGASVQEYEVLEYGTGRATEAGLLGYDIPSDLFEEALGAEIATGTLPADNLYKITATTGNHFYTGDAVGEYFTSVGTETCDASNKVQQVTNAVDSGDGLAPPHGTSIAWWRVPYNRVDGGGNNGLVHLHTQFGFMWQDSGSACVSYDTSSYASVLFDFEADTEYKFIVKWGYLVDNELKMRVGYDAGAGVVWGTESDFDGTYRVGSNLLIGGQIWDTFHIKRFHVYAQTLSDAEIDATTDVS